MAISPSPTTAAARRTASVARSTPADSGLGAASLRAQYSLSDTPIARAASRSAPCRPGLIRRTKRPEQLEFVAEPILISLSKNMILPEMTEVNGASGGLSPDRPLRALMVRLVDETDVGEHPPLS